MGGELQFLSPDGEGIFSSGVIPPPSPPIRETPACTKSQTFQLNRACTKREIFQLNCACAKSKIFQLNCAFTKSKIFQLKCARAKSKIFQLKCTCTKSEIFQLNCAFRGGSRCSFPHDYPPPPLTHGFLEIWDEKNSKIWDFFREKRKI